MDVLSAAAGCICIEVWRYIRRTPELHDCHIVNLVSISQQVLNVYFTCEHEVWVQVPPECMLPLRLSHGSGLVLCYVALRFFLSFGASSFHVYMYIVYKAILVPP